MKTGQSQRERMHHIQDFRISYDLSWAYRQACACIPFMTRPAHFSTGKQPNLRINLIYKFINFLK